MWAGSVYVDKIQVSDNIKYSMNIFLWNTNVLNFRIFKYIHNIIEIRVYIIKKNVFRICKVYFVHM